MPIGKRSKHLLGIYAAFYINRRRTSILNLVICHDTTYSVNDTPIHSEIQLSKAFYLTNMPGHGEFSFVRQGTFLSSRWTYLGLPTWNAAWITTYVVVQCFDCTRLQQLDSNQDMGLQVTNAPSNWPQ